MKTASSTIAFGVAAARPVVHPRAFTIAPVLTTAHLITASPPGPSSATMTASAPTQHEPSYRMLTMVIIIFAIGGFAILSCVKLVAPSRLRANLEYLGVAVNKACLPRARWGGTLTVSAPRSR